MLLIRNFTLARAKIGCKAYKNTYLPKIRPILPPKRSTMAQAAKTDRNITDSFFTPARSNHGEVPCWDIASGTVYFVDMEPHCSVHRFTDIGDVDSYSYATVPNESFCTAVFPVQGDADRFVGVYYICNSALPLFVFQLNGNFLEPSRRQAQGVHRKMARSGSWRAVGNDRDSRCLAI